MRVWNPDKPEVKNSTELKGHTMGVDRVAWDPVHPDRLASCSGDGTLRFWDHRSEIEIPQTRGDRWDADAASG